MIQSLVRKDSVADLVAGYGHVIVDECHHLPAVQFERVLRHRRQPGDPFVTEILGVTVTVKRLDSATITRSSWCAHRDDLLREIRARRERQEPTRTRTLRNEQVWIGPNSTVFIGETIEQIPPGGRFSGDYDGTNTLVWVRDGAAWKAAIWQWGKAGIDAARDEWNLTYLYSFLGKSHTATGHFNTQPNKFLVEMVKGRKPGRALDISMGQGRNALYLASQGWQVTGIDISDEALREAREAAAARKLHVEIIDADEATWDYGIEKWDLLVMTYGGCGDNRTEACKRSLKPGGLVVAEFFHKDTNPRIGAATGELSALFKDGFKILRDDVVEDVSDWGDQKDPEKLVRFAAEKL